MAKNRLEQQHHLLENDLGKEMKGGEGRGGGEKSSKVMFCASFLMVYVAKTVLSHTV